ncbi:MAG: HNH endonuclease, partial [Terriglobia bacterium]
IVPVAIPTSTDETCNGIALCSLHHLAFDRGLVAIDDTYKILASESEKTLLKKIHHDGGMKTFLSSLHKLILLPPSVSDRPNIHYLQMGREVRHWVG